LLHYYNVLLFGMPIAILPIKESNLRIMEDVMKKFAKMFEDLWVAVAFAEEGIYEAAAISEAQPRCSDSVRAHAA
jgi:hypothetical protein